MNRLHVGTINATGYIIRTATVNIITDEEASNPATSAEIEIIADVVWVNKADSSFRAKPTSLRLDMDKESFLENGLPLDIINRKEVFDGVMKILVGSIKGR